MILKDQLFNERTVSMLGDKIEQAYDKFDKDSFVRECMRQFPSLELKQRMSYVEQMLEAFLPPNYEKTIQVLSKAMSTVTKGHFIYGSVLEYIQKQGCTPEHVDLSLEKLGEFTSKMSAEFAIRTFLNRFPSKTMDYVMEWAMSDDVHKRRLASEGTRPSLPWAPKIDVDYTDAATPLDYLYTDKERYVTRSVANHLNDISKIDPSFVLNKLKQWIESNKQNPDEMKYIVQHALRTLVKKGHPQTLMFLGYKPNPKIRVVNFTLSSDTIKKGDTQEFELILDAHETTNILIDFIVTYPTKHQKTTHKVYKLMTIKAEQGKRYPIKGRRKFEDQSTRKIYPGLHKIEIQLNGRIIISQEFTVI